MPKTRASLVQIERYGVTIVFENVDAAHIGDVLDTVLAQLGMLEKMHELAPQEVHPTVGGYTPLEVPEEYEEETTPGPVVGFNAPH